MKLSAKIKIFSFILLFGILALFSSCSKSSNEEMNVLGGDCEAYRCDSFEILNYDNYYDVYNIIEYDGSYYILMVEYLDDSFENSLIKFCKYTLDGEKIQEFIPNQDINVYVESSVYDNKFYYTTWNGTFEILNLSSGNIDYSEHYENLVSVSTCNDGYVLIYQGMIEKYNYDNKKIASIKNNEWLFFNGHDTFYEKDGFYYLLADTGYSWKYYKLDFDNSTSEMRFSPSDSGINATMCSGQYMFTDQGEYLIDLENNTMQLLADWSVIDYKPAQYSVNYETFIGINDNEFINIYSYVNGIAEINIYTYDPAITYSDRIPIIIGGIDCIYDIPLRWAVYNFNTSQTEYRAYIEDYSRTFCWDDTVDMNTRYLELIKYFNEGNNPDIYYGNFFDYDYFYTNGITQNITPYLDEQAQTILSGVTPNIRDLMVDGDICYRLFSSYRLSGYIGSSEVFDNKNDISFDDLLGLEKNKNVTPIVPDLASNIAINAIEYSNVQNDGFTVDELVSILQFAFRYGYQDFGAYTSVELDNVNVHRFGVFDYSIVSPNTLYDYEQMTQQSFVYIGFPSLYGSAHAIEPFAQVGMASTTKYPEGCALFMVHLFDENVQRFAYLNSQVPVVDEMLEECILYNSNHDSIMSSDIAISRQIVLYDEISQQAANDFRNACHSADTIIRHDNGLVQIIVEEVMTYYISDRTVEQIAESLESRLNLYIQENYN